MKCSKLTSSAEDTECLAEKIAANLRGGEVIELVSDLGGGKTTLVRGLAKGLGSSDRVASPTFTISKVYQAGSLELHHFDFYRLHDAGVVSHELHDLMDDLGIVTVIEWAEAVHHVLPPKRLTITIQSIDTNKRELQLVCPAELDYILEGIC